MTIQINLNGNKYAIKIDANNYTPVAYSINKDPKSANFGKETERDIAYCTSFANAALKIIRSEVSTSNDTVTLQEFVTRVEGLNQEIIEQFNKVKI